MLEKGQYSPMHFHWNKMENIINRGGGCVLIQVCRSMPDEAFDTADVQVYQDGRSFLAAETFSLQEVGPGNLENRNYESFSHALNSSSEMTSRSQSFFLSLAALCQAANCSSVYFPALIQAKRRLYSRRYS